MQMWAKKGTRITVDKILGRDKNRPTFDSKEELRRYMRERVRRTGGMA